MTGQELYERLAAGYDYDPMYAEAITERDKLRDKNAKLQEMVEDMLSCIEIRAAFGRPPTEEMYETFAQRARELGIEVEDA